MVGGLVLVWGFCWGLGWATGCGRGGLGCVKLFPPFSTEDLVSSYSRCTTIEVRPLESRLAMPWDPESELRSIVENLFAENQRIYNEAGLQINLGMKLKACDPELPMTFEPPRLPAKVPTAQERQELASLEKPFSVPDAGVDPCKPRACLDLLWHTANGNIPVELKFVREWKSDTYGYDFLKDLHRLERLKSVRGVEEISDQRLALFVTREEVYWQGRRPEPEPFLLTDGLTLTTGHWVQYDQPSPRTRWVTYPPFYLSNSYTFRWQDLSAGFRYLLVPVMKQTDGDD